MFLQTRAMPPYGCGCEKDPASAEGWRTISNKPARKAGFNSRRISGAPTVPLWSLPGHKGLLPAGVGLLGFYHQTDVSSW